MERLISIKELHSMMPYRICIRTMRDLVKQQDKFKVMKHRGQLAVWECDAKALIEEIFSCPLPSFKIPNLGSTTSGELYSVNACDKAQEQLTKILQKKCYSRRRRLSREQLV